MKKIIFSEDFITEYSIRGSLDINWVSNNININKEIEKSHADISTILDIIFKQFYYAQSHYLREKRKDIVAFLLRYVKTFERAINYEQFLVIIFIHLVILDEREEMIEKLISTLNEFYGENLWVEQLDFTKNAFLQYSAAYYHKHGKNDEAKKILEFVNRIQHNMDFSATNYFLLTTVYISGGKHREAFIACQRASQAALDSGNFTRYFYCEMNRARICSSMGDFLDAIEIYQECLNGSETIAPQSRNYLIENIATNFMYLAEYQKAIEYIDRIPLESINNNAAYICALSYFELGDRSEAAKWVEIGKNAIYAHKTAELFIKLIEILMIDNSELIINCLREMCAYEKTTENYATHNYVTRRLMKQYAKMEDYKQAYKCAEYFLKL